MSRELFNLNKILVTNQCQIYDKFRLNRQKAEQLTKRIGQVITRAFFIS